MRGKEASNFKCLKFEERLLNNALSSIKCDETRSMINDLENKRYEDQCSLDETHAKIQNSLNELHKNVTSTEKIKNLDVNYYRNHIQELFAQILDFRHNLEEKHSIVKKNITLLQEEAVLAVRLCSTFDTTAFYKTFYVLPTKCVKVVKCVPSSKNEDVVNFQDFLHRNGGHTGGWGDEEHKIFLKYWDKHYHNLKNDNYGQYTIKMQDFIDDVQHIISDKTQKDISSHAEWMLKYNNLKELQLDAISNWKLMREADRHHIKILETSALKTLSKEKQPCPTKKQKIKDWQLVKDSERKLENAVQVDAVIANKELNDARKIVRKREKEIIAQWIKEQKAEEENARSQLKEQLLHDKKIKSVKACEKIKEFRKRDEAITNNRVSQIKNYNNAKSDYFSKLSVLNRRVEKNDNQPPRGSYAAFTEQWARRITKNKIKSADTPINIVDNIPKLKIPQWRQGLTFR